MAKSFTGSIKGLVKGASRFAYRQSVYATRRTRQFTGLADEFDDPNANRRIHQRLVGAAFRSVEEQTLGKMGGIGRGMSRTLRGERGAIKGEIKRAIRSATLGRMGHFGSAFGAEIDKRNLIVDEKDLGIERKRVAHSEKISASEVFEMVTKLDKTLKKNFKIINKGNKLLAKDFERITERFNKLEQIINERIADAAQKVSDDKDVVLDTVSSKIDNLVTSVDSVQRTLTEHDQQIKQLYGELDILEKKSQGSGAASDEKERSEEEDTFLSPNERKKLGLPVGLGGVARGMGSGALRLLATKGALVAGGVGAAAAAGYMANEAGWFDGIKRWFGAGPESDPNMFSGDAVPQAKPRPYSETKPSDFAIKTPHSNFDPNTGQFRGPSAQPPSSGVERFAAPGLIQNTPQQVTPPSSTQEEGGQKEVPTSSIPENLGFVSAKYESSGRGVGFISSGKGDPGGPSYGIHQLSGRYSMGAFLRSKEGEPYRELFGSARPMTPEFNRIYKQIAAQDPEGFAKAQHAFYTRTHFMPLYNHAKKLGFNVDDRGVQEALFSMSVQHGGARKIVSAVAKAGATGKSTEEQIKALYQHRTNYVAGLKNLPPNWKTGIFNRYRKEVQDALGLVGQKHEGIGAPVETAPGEMVPQQNVSHERVAEKANETAATRVVQMQQEVAGIRRLPIKKDLENALDYAAHKSGVYFEVTSGGQHRHGPRTGSHRHDVDNPYTIGAADGKMYVFDEDGKKRYLSIYNKNDRELISRFTESFAAVAPQSGVGTDYMGRGAERGRLFHFGGPNDRHGDPVAYKGPEWFRKAHAAGVEKFGSKDVVSDYQNFLAEREKALQAQQQGIEPVQKAEPVEPPSPVPIRKPPAPEMSLPPLTPQEHIIPKQEAPKPEAVATPLPPVEVEPEKFETPVVPATMEAQKPPTEDTPVHERSGSEVADYSSSDPIITPPYFHPESAAPEPGDNGYGEYKRCLV